MHDELREPRLASPVGGSALTPLAPPVLRLSETERLAEEAQARAAEEKRQQQVKDEAAFQRKIKQFQDFIDTQGIADAASFLGDAVESSRASLEKAVPFLRFGPPPGPTPRQKDLILSLQTTIDRGAMLSAGELQEYATGMSLQNQEITSEEIVAVLPALRFPAPRYGGLSATYSGGIFASPAAIPVGRGAPPSRVADAVIDLSPAEGETRTDDTGTVWIYSSDRWWPTGGANAPIAKIAEALQAGTISRETAIVRLAQLPGTTVIDTSAIASLTNFDRLPTVTQIERLQDLIDNGTISAEAGDLLITGLISETAKQKERRAQIYVALQKRIVEKGYLSRSSFWQEKTPLMPDGSTISGQEMDEIVPFLRFYQGPGIYSEPQKVDATLPLITLGDRSPLAVGRTTDLTRARENDLLDRLIPRLGNIAPNMRGMFRQQYQDALIRYGKQVQGYDVAIRDETPMAVDLRSTGNDTIGINGVTWRTYYGVNVMPDRFFQLLMQAKGGQMNAVNDALEELNARTTRGLRTGFGFR